jgi:hypothetical protein
MKIGGIAACALVLGATTLKAQAPCLTNKAVVDSARSDAMSVLTSGRPLILEMRQEQHVTEPDNLAPVKVVSDRYVCSRLAGTFNRIIAPGMRFAVLKIGPLYYARDPDQRRGTGVITDSTFQVLLRLGAAVESREK